MPRDSHSPGMPNSSLSLSCSPWTPTTHVTMAQSPGTVRTAMPPLPFSVLTILPTSSPALTVGNMD